MSILQIVDLKKDYGEEPNITHALKGIQFEVDKGEFVGIMGASGSGKTTLLNCISTIDTATDGHIYLDGKDILEIREKDIARFRRESLGFIFQDFNLLDTLTIEENIALALTINKVSANKIDSQIQQIAAKLNITDILNKYPYQVSGGQKQRCACARAIINHPKLILADEPTGALDSHSSQMLLSTIQEMNEQMDATIIVTIAFAACLMTVLALYTFGKSHELKTFLQGRYQAAVIDVDLETINDLRQDSNIEMVGTEALVDSFRVDDYTLNVNFRDSNNLYLYSTEFVGNLPDKENEVAVSEAYLKHIGRPVELNQEIELPLQNGKNANFTVCGLLHDDGANRRYQVLVSDSFLQSYFQDHIPYNATLRIMGSGSFVTVKPNRA